MAAQATTERQDQGAEQVPSASRSSSSGELQAAAAVDASSGDWLFMSVLGLRKRRTRGGCGFGTDLQCVLEEKVVLMCCESPPNDE